MDDKRSYNIRIRQRREWDEDVEELGTVRHQRISKSRTFTREDMDIDDDSSELRGDITSIPANIITNENPSPETITANQSFNDTMEIEQDQLECEADIEDYTNTDDLGTEPRVRVDGPADFKAFEGEYGPYFTDFTSTMLFIWITKHMISTAAYDDLIKIIQHPSFRVDDVVPNIRRLRKWYTRLPLLSVFSHNIKINNRQTPSTSQPEKPAYTLSLIEHISRVLKNPKLFSKMYFGPGMIAESNSEFWHGRMWQESPLFGKEEIQINEGWRGQHWLDGEIVMICTITIVMSFLTETYQTGEFIEFTDGNNSQRIGRINSIVMADQALYLMIQELLKYSDLPTNLKTNSRSENQNRLWLMEKPFTKIQDNAVQNRVTVWLEDLPEPAYYDYSANEIVYSHNGRWKARDVVLRHRHPTEYIKLDKSPEGMTILKIFLDLYYDDFGTYRNTYHALGGVYLQIGNMPLQLRKQLRNHFLLGLVPFGGNFQDFTQPILNEIQQLQKGMTLETVNGPAWIVGGLGCVTADLPQGNDLAGVKRHNAQYGCRTCKVPHDHMSDATFDVIKNGRYRHITRAEFEKIENSNTRASKGQLAQEYGLRIGGSPLNGLLFDCHIQIPQDAYHAFAGKIHKLLEATLAILSSEGKENWILAWKNFETPTGWGKLPNPLTHINSFMFSDGFRLAIIMPFLLHRFLTASCIKSLELQNLRSLLGKNNDGVIRALVKCWVKVAKTTRLAFSSSFTEEQYQELHDLLEAERHSLLKLFPTQFSNLPNIHVNFHYMKNAQNFATLVNTAVGVKEMMHRTFKQMVPHTNRKNIEESMVRHYNTHQALAYLFDGGIDNRFAAASSGITGMATDQLVRSILAGWYATSSDDKEVEIDDEKGERHPTKCHLDDVINVWLKRKWNAREIQNAGFHGSLNGGNPLLADLSDSYVSDLSMASGIVHNRVEFFHYVRYDVINDTSMTTVNLRVGDVIDILEESEGMAYATISAIIRHRANSGDYYAFFIFSWLEARNERHDLDVPLYLCDRDTWKWRRVFPISFIDHTPRIHFVHDCRDTCSPGNHDSSNLRYLRNDFYFGTV